MFWENISLYKKTLLLVIDDTPGKTIINKWHLEKSFNQLEHNIKLEQVLSDEFDVEIDERATKNITVFVDESTISCKKGFVRSSGISLNPTQITIKGAKSILNQIQDSLLLTLSTQNISDDFDEDIELSFKEYKNIKVSHSSVTVTFDVAELVPNQFELPYKLANYNPGDSLYSFTEKTVLLKCLVPENIPINSEEFVLQLDFKKGKLKKDTVLPVTILSIPSYVFEPSIPDSLINVTYKIKRSGR